MIVERQDVWYADDGGLTYTMCEDDGPLSEPIVIFHNVSRKKNIYIFYLNLLARKLHLVVLVMRQSMRSFLKASGPGIPTQKTFPEMNGEQCFLL